MASFPAQQTRSTFQVAQTENTARSQEWRQILLIRLGAWSALRNEQFQIGRKRSSFVTYKKHGAESE